MSPALCRSSLLAVALFAMSGCGFQPVYMPTASGKPGPAARELSAVNVATIAERPGQLLRQALQERFGSDAGLPQHYNLLVTFSIAGEGTLIRPDTTATRLRLTGYVNWTLTSLDSTHTRLTSGSARAFDGFNIMDQQYFAADLENEMVTKRLANALADQVTLQLATWFRQRANPTKS